jgi:hypothetical protein
MVAFTAGEATEANWIKESKVDYREKAVVAHANRYAFDSCRHIKGDILINRISAILGRIYL